MTTSEIAILVSTTLAISIPIVIYLRKRYFVGGFLTIKFDFERGLSEPKGVLKPFVDEDGVGIRDKSIVRHHLTWVYNLTITNNSDNTAFFPKLYYKNDLFPNITIEDLEELKPIGSKESINIEIKFLEISDTLPAARRKTDLPPENFNTLKLLLEYYNSQHSCFYTLYNNADKMNHSSKFRPQF